MPRRLRVPKAISRELSWWMRLDLSLGPIHLSPMGGGTLALTPEEKEAAYQRGHRRGFSSIAAMKAYWGENRRYLATKEDVGDWWAATEWPL